MEQENQLEIRMFGKFEMIYHGQILNFGHSQTTKAMKLLQLLLFYGEQGIHRSQVVQHLFGVDAEGNIQSNLKVVVYNLRKILEQSGLPAGNYISVQGGVYKFISDFSIRVDVKEFETLVVKAKESPKEEQYELLKNACELYKGHFLPEIYGDDWVIINSSRYQNLYTDCLEILTELLKEKGEYKELYKVSKHASSLYPLDEWQVYEIEALIALGDTKAAMELYDKTTTMYFEELSLSPSDKMLGCFAHMRDQIQMKSSDILEIQDLMNEKEFLTGAFFCQYPSFADGYRMMSRMMERSGQSVYLLVCTLDEEKRQLTEESDYLKGISELLHCAIQKSLRRGDVFTRYNAKQYLVMLPGIRKEECSIVTSRIDKNFRKICTNRNVRIHFHTSSVKNNINL